MLSTFIYIKLVKGNFEKVLNDKRFQKMFFEDTVQQCCSCQLLSVEFPAFEMPYSIISDSRQTNA